MVTYYARFEPDHEAGGYVVTFPDLRHGATQGETLEEATSMAEDFLACVIALFMEREEGLPKARKRRGPLFHPVSLPGIQSAKVELYQAFRASGLTKTQLASRMGIAKSNLDRLFDLQHQSRFDQIEAAFAALDKQVWVEIRDAA
jgi:antitoxin HicB